MAMATCHQKTEMLLILEVGKGDSQVSLEHESHSGNASKGLLQFTSFLGAAPGEAQPQAPVYAGDTMLESSFTENWGSWWPPS